jgi:hypothetical protein
MIRSLTRGRLYRTIAIALSVAIVCMAFQPPQWEWLQVRVARVASLLDPATMDQLSAAATTSTLDAITSALPDDLASPLISPSPHPRVSPPPLSVSVSRVQSAYTPGETISGTLVVTFTISNNRPPVLMPQISENGTLTETAAVLEAFDPTADPNAIHNVPLVDSLTAHASFVSSTPRPDHKDDTYTWNLADIPPIKSITITLTLSVPTSVATVIELDIGAIAWGTADGRSVHAQARLVIVAEMILVSLCTPGVALAHAHLSAPTNLSPSAPALQSFVAAISQSRTLHCVKHPSRLGNRAYDWAFFPKRELLMGRLSLTARSPIPAWTTLT